MLATDKKRLGPIRLCDIAEIQPGYLSRSAVRHEYDGAHWFVQARDVSPDGTICFETAVRFRPERKNSDLYKISRGDILFVARGEHRAYLVDRDILDALVSSTFYIIRPLSGMVRPAYLSWWLNQPDVQAQIASGSCGTGIGYISREALEKLIIATPPLSLQIRIEQIVDLRKQQVNLQSQLDLKREQYIQALCRQAVLYSKE